MKFRQPISKKTGFLVFSLVAIASLTSAVLTSCSTAPDNQSQAQNTSKTDDAAKQNMEHGSGMNHGSGMSGMDHSMAMDLGPADADYDLRFVDAMTPHHQGAVEMAKEALSKSKRPEIKKLAQDIIAAQNREINQLKQWRQAWYPKADSTPMAYNAQMRSEER